MNTPKQIAMALVATTRNAAQMDKDAPERAVLEKECEALWGKLCKIVGRKGALQEFAAA